jgi:alpha-beta hydrolase superfamily lysophospholipase
MESSTPNAHQMPFAQLYLPGKNGKKLYSWHIPAGEREVTLVIAHGWGANIEMMLPLAKPFFEAGIDILLYDARNHGRSDSDSFSSLPRFADDLESALDWLKQYKPNHKVVVLGHSIGAAAAILSASRRDDIDLLIGIAGFAHPKLVMNRHLDRGWLPGFIKPIIMGYIQWVIGSNFEDIAPMNRIVDVECPVLLTHGMDDETVPISDMYLIKESALRSNITTISIEGARHTSLTQFNQNSARLIGFIEDQLMA